MMILPTAFCNPAIKKVLEAAIYPSAVKSVGSGFRYYDARNADPELKKNIARGEALTVGQVSLYSIIIDQLLGLVQKAASHASGESLLKTSLQKLTKNRPLTLMVLGCVANFCAEKISRKVFERDLGPDGNSLADDLSNDLDDLKDKLKSEIREEFKDKDDHHEDRHDSHDGHQRTEPASVALRFAQSPQPLRHQQQSLAFARSNAAAANPFQFAGQQFKPAFAKPAFSI